MSETEGEREKSRESVTGKIKRRKKDGKGWIWRLENEGMNREIWIVKGRKAQKMSDKDRMDIIKRVVKK